MKRLHILLAELTVLAWAFAPMASARDWFVTTNGTGLGTNGWADATNSIQGAIDKATTNDYDVVWVSNGVYATGGVTNWPATAVLTNRVAIWKAITVRAFSTNPADTVIKGRFDTGEPGAAGTVTNGPAAVRCVYMAANSKLIGFTLTNGATLATGTDDRYGSGVYCPAIYTPTISNCVIAGNSASGVGGGAYCGTLYNCTIVGNLAGDGGGARYAIMYNCTLIGNSANSGGGEYDATLYNCTLTGNSAFYYGGGVYRGTLYNCTLINNYAGSQGGGVSGGGEYAATLYNCTLTGNSTEHHGGGAKGGILYNCTVVGNSAAGNGGGAENSILYNCTLVGNSGAGGGAYFGTLYNCISWSNSTADTSPTAYYSCGAGYTNGGSVSGNTTNNPMFVANGNGQYGTNHVAGNYRLSNNSPCINTGTNMLWMTNSWGQIDRDGRMRIRYGTVDMGAYEFIHKGTVFTGR